ncbi:MAG: primosomal protein N', partial [Bacteroidota bacterium]
MSTTFADLILPIPLPKLLTYRVPEAYQTVVVPGSRVIAPLGPKKILTGIVDKVHNTPPDYVTKDLIEVLDDAPVIQSLQLKFFHWLARYYLCTVGEVLQLALPTGLKLSSQSKIQLNPAFDLSKVKHSDKALQLVQALQERLDLTYTEAAAVVGQKSAHALIKLLLHQGAILLFEEMKEKYTPKRIHQVRLNEAYTQDEGVRKALFEQLEKHNKQLDVLLKYLTQVSAHPDKPLEEYWIEKKTLLAADISAASLQTLLKKGIFVEQTTIVSRFGHLPTASQPLPRLSAAQRTASKAIHQQWKDKATVLLHGVTGSGKTEIYTHLIQEALQSGGQVLYLLPEIALTTQIVKRLQKIFGNQMGVYHSKYSNNERVEVWNHVLAGKFSFVLGVRSAIFLPFDNLSLIIVDEEHETSYKQFDAQPRYHARDAALMLAQYHHAKVLLGSATPAVETYYHAQTGKYGLVSLTERYGEAVLPTMELVNVRIARERKAMREDFAQTLIDALEEVLERQEQAIIFQNRRGYAPYITCEDCAWVPMCTQCAVSLTYHQRSNHLRCHYCGYYTPMPPACGVCDSHRLKNVSFGTEKLEETLQLFFPKKTVQRMDLDTTRGKYSYDRLIEGLEQGQID